MADPAASTEDRWPAIESNAEVMTDFLHKLCSSQEGDTTTGAAAAFSFADVFALEPDCLAFVPQPVHALVLAYASEAISKEGDSSSSGTTSSESESGSGDGGDKVVFIRQLPALDAACGTIATIHALANSPELRAATAPGSLLGKFLGLGSSAPPASTPEAWGARLDADDALRAAHCACAAAGVTEEVHGDAVVFHFVAFLPSATDPAAVVELDGLKPRPVVHAVPAEGGGGFLERAAHVIRTKFLGKFKDPEATQMNVLALTSGAGED